MLKDCYSLHKIKRKTDKSKSWYQHWNLFVLNVAVRATPPTLRKFSNDQQPSKENTPDEDSGGLIILKTSLFAVMFMEKSQKSLRKGPDSDRTSQ
jgi:hypothetical protein